MSPSRISLRPPARAERRLHDAFLVTLLDLTCVAPGANVPFSHSFWAPATGAAACFAGALLGPRFFSCALTQLNPDSHLYSRYPAPAARIVSAITARDHNAPPAQP